MNTRSAVKNRHKTTASTDILRRLGFQPDESVVIACVHHDPPRDGMVARVDIDSLYDIAIRASMLQRLAGPLQIAGPDAVVVAYYTETDPRLLVEIDADVTTWLAELQISREATVLIDGTGAEVTRRSDLAVIDPVSSPRRREAWTEFLDGSIPTIEDYLLAVDHARQCRALPATVVGRVGRWLAEISNRDAAVLLIAGASVEHARKVAAGERAADEVGAAMNALLSPIEGIVPPHEIHHHRTVLTEIVRCMPGPYQVPPRTLLGLINWWAGDGATAARHIEEALSLDPDYRLAVLLNGVLDAGIAPGWAHRRPE